MNPRFPLMFALVAALGAATPTWAERADRDKPVNIEADTLRHDDLRQTSVFTGKVVLTKGTLVLRGTRIEVRQDAEGYQFGTVTADPGQRAFYRQKRDLPDEHVEGEAEVIEYDGRADRVRFIRRAELRRYRGVTVADEVTGNVIVYENTSEQFSVDGGPAGGSSGGRVRATLAPRNAASAPVVPPASLRTSPNLGGAPR